MSDELFERELKNCNSNFPDTCAFLVRFEGRYRCKNPNNCRFQKPQKGGAEWQKVNPRS